MKERTKVILAILSLALAIMTCLTVYGPLELQRVHLLVLGFTCLALVTTLVNHFVQQRERRLIIEGRERRFVITSPLQIAAIKIIVFLGFLLVLLLLFRLLHLV